MISIVGGGLAAAKLVESYREAGGTEPIVVHSQDDRPPYHRPPLSKALLRGEVEPPAALVHDASWYAERGVQLRLGDRVESLDDLDGETVVLATGARPRALGDALQLRTLDDALALRATAADAETATVVGGGFIGCEVAASLSVRGLKVTHVIREAGPFWILGAPALSQALHRRYLEHGVDQRLEATEIPDADLVVAGVGVEPNVELAEAAGLEVDDGIVVDERFRTGREGVYAIGDVARFFDPVYGKHRRIEHWSNAAYHGTQLGKLLAGDGDARYDRVSTFFSEQFGHVFKLFGDSSGHDALEVEGSFHDRAVGRYLRGGQLVAAVHTGLTEEEENALLEEIRAAVSG